jgi:hypothetical protein
MDLEQDIGTLDSPILRVIAHVCIARARCITGIQPYLAFTDRRTIQMKCDRELRLARVANFVVSN